jgi:putative transposase
MPLDRHRSINAMAESFFSTLEAELLSRRRFASQAEARMACFSYIEGWYNPVRLHSALGCRSPMTYEAETQTAVTDALPVSQQTVHRNGATSTSTWI